METFQTTVRKVFEALEKNGFQHLRGAWFRTEDNDGSTVVIGGCVLGQAAINIGAFQPIEPMDTWDTLQEGTLLYALNKFPAIDGKWNVPLDTMDNRVNSVAGQIMFWNDKMDYSLFPATYVLKTWDEVVEMARELLTPYFDKEITLRSYEWNAKPLAVV